ncbi:hypothetical protein [Erythrobacter ani]|uniref:Uncharacterized protein n=1 Tax=Erythrobacter ani TaxID=2827235 RepID=A0ABS6SL57_9SPHN|nr:hypothetical protein [Erythrobacter ani]MBV7265751.1 hypothetical protein [Erythrobacter ani]
MRALKALFGWIFRNALLFALIVAALVAHAIWTQNQVDDTAAIADTNKRILELERAGEKARKLQEALRTEAETANAELTQFAIDSHDATLDQLQAARTEAKSNLRRLEGDLPSGFEEARQIAMADAEALAATALTKLQITRLNRQIDFLDESIAIASGNVSTQALIDGLNTQLKTARQTFDDAEEKCDAAADALQKFDDKWFVGKFLAGGKAERRSLERVKTTQCGARDAARTARQALDNSLRNAKKALDNSEAAMDGGIAAATAALAELERQSDETRALLLSTLDEGEEEVGRLAQEYQLALQARNALLILIGIIATPFLIRALFYYAIAPLAERRAAIRIAVPGSSGLPKPATEPSRVSIPVTLSGGEELLVRQDYLQTSSVDGEKSTRWLLDYGHILSSIATGLTFLTRIRGTGTTTISAVKDPFAELTEIDMPDGASCVLHPRALVAVVQPSGRTMRISSHWRLFSLNAWLTMQLRFMVFHGPGRLIVKGGRGVRVEAAEQGRIFGQDQLVGFSAELSYSVTRTETFAPYLFGYEQLFKDKVLESNGILIIEEAPLAGRGKWEVRRGLEGALDAGMKAFGL